MFDAVLLRGFGNLVGSLYLGASAKAIVAAGVLCLNSEASVTGKWRMARRRCCFPICLPIFKTYSILLSMQRVPQLRNRNLNAVRNDIHGTSIIRPHSTISVNSDLQCIAPLNRLALYGCISRWNSNLKNAFAADCEPDDEIKRASICSTHS